MDFTKNTACKIRQLVVKVLILMQSHKYDIWYFDKEKKTVQTPLQVKLKVVFAEINSTCSPLLSAMGSTKCLDKTGGLEMSAISTNPTISRSAGRQQI